jgi:hypothetical protein
VERVSAGEWEDYRRKLKEAYRRMDELSTKLPHGMRTRWGALSPSWCTLPIISARSARRYVRFVRTDYFLPS